MRKEINCKIYLVLLFAFTSCHHKMRPAEYISYMNKKGNGIKKIQVVDGWEFCFQYRPYDYIMLLENKGNSKDYDFDKRKEELRGTIWFSIKIKRLDNSISPLRYGITSSEEYNSRLNYYLNEAQKDVRLIYDKDTLQVASYLFENNFNLTPDQTMLTGFYLPQGESYPQKRMHLSFTDQVFKTGIVNAEFSEETLKNIPTLTY